MASTKFSLFFSIENDDKYTGAPVYRTVRGDLDAHGDFLDLRRLDEESGYSYLKRLRSVIPLRAGSDQSGLIHGITRELGLDEKIGLEITPVASGSTHLAPAPHIEITATSLILYSEWYSADSYTIDSQVDIFDRGEGYLVGDLVNKIMESQYFVAELGSYMTGDEKSRGLFQGESTIVVEREFVPSASYFLLEHNDLVSGSVSFTEKTIFDDEKSTGSSVAVAGDYYIDYVNGAVTSFSQATGQGTCRYQYRDFPWRVRWSPITVYSLRDTDYRDKLFEHETMLDNSERDGLVTAEGSSVYSRLFELSTCLWGR